MILPIITVLLAELILQIGSYVIREETIMSGSGSPEPQAFITSSAFPQPYGLDRIIHKYTIHNTDVGYIQLVFTDFDLHEQSVLKIYDGETVSDSSSFIFHGRSRPVFQSASNYLIVVFKSGPHPDTDDMSNYEHVGFKAEVSFVNYPRESWKDNQMPSIGYCPPIVDSQGQINLIQNRYTGDLLYYDCVWLLRPPSGQTMYMKIEGIDLRQGNASSGTLQVRNGNNSGASLVAELYEPDPDSSMYSGAALYLRLTGYLEYSDHLLFYYGTTPDLGPSLPPSISTGCPYKLSWGSCVNYWETNGEDDSCHSDSHAGSTDYSHCSDNDKCYGHYDVCDTFRDCGEDSEDDEENCEGSWTNYLSFVPILVFCILVYVCCAKGERSASFKECVTGICAAIVTCRPCVYGARAVRERCSRLCSNARDECGGVLQRLNCVSQTDPAPPRSPDVDLTVTDATSATPTASVRRHSGPPVWHTSSGVDVNEDMDARINIGDPLAPPPSYDRLDHSHHRASYPPPPDVTINPHLEDVPTTPPPSYEDAVSSPVVPLPPSIQSPPPPYSESNV